MSYFRENIDALTAYQPGEQPAGGRPVIKLNTNENPYPPSPAAMAVLRAFDPDALRRYPHPYAQAVRNAAARLLDVEPGWVLVGNGSDDLLTMLMRSTVEHGRDVVYPMPTYVLYRTLAQIQDARCVEVDFDDDYSLPVAALAEAGGAVTIIANPNSPSGTLAPLDQLERLAEALAGRLLVVDEAYIDFAPAGSSAVALVKKYENVIVLRTLSKGYSLAGLRLGFGIGQPTTLAGLMKVKDSYNVDAIAAAVGAAALEDQAHVRANAERVIASRQRLSDQLEQLGWRVWPSESNFLLARPADGQAGELYQALKQRGILVRYFNQPRLTDKLRITVGTDEQNDELLAALGEIAAER
jgi:histidinol-phosphate aminotransferase